MAPHALVACYDWKEHVDVLSILNFDQVITARVALLDLVHPAHPDAPIGEYPAPVIQSPSPGQGVETRCRYGRS
jgi:hypothetical protein